MTLQLPPLSGTRGLHCPINPTKSNKQARQAAEALAGAASEEAEAGSFMLADLVVEAELDSAEQSTVKGVGFNPEYSRTLTWHVGTVPHAVLKVQLGICMPSSTTTPVP